MIRFVRTEVNGQVFGHCAVFTDLDGNVVSVAFHHRADSDGFRFTYPSYSDCPVQTDFPDMRESGMCEDLTALRFLRDALNRMNLGD